MREILDPTKAKCLEFLDPRPKPKSSSSKQSHCPVSVKGGDEVSPRILTTDRSSGRLFLCPVGQRSSPLLIVFCSAAHLEGREKNPGIGRTRGHRSRRRTRPSIGTRICFLVGGSWSPSGCGFDEVLLEKTCHCHHFWTAAPFPLLSVHVDRCLQGGDDKRRHTALRTSTSRLCRRAEPQEANS